jgi:UPF0755 protein
MPSKTLACRPLRRAGILVFGALAFVAAACGSNDTTPVHVTIRKGSNFREAADSLAAHQLVSTPRLFGFYAARVKRDRTIRYGTYVIPRGASWGDILTALESGKGIVHRVRIPEGWTLWDIVPALATGLSISEDTVWAAVRDPELLRRARVPAGQRSLEGYLFPDTYDFPDGVTARQAVELMLRRFELVWKPEWDARLPQVGLRTRHQAVTLAAIIEKEVRVGSERPLVSAVYHNRLRINMLLQADPTIQYALGRRRPARVLYRDLEVNSPYNTYRRRGLPPGPIASPGAASLEAALFPADTNLMFFVAHPDGHHEFRRTHREHLAAIQMVRAIARREAAERRARAQRAAVDSALKAVGVPRTTYDSLSGKRPPE